MNSKELRMKSCCIAWRLFRYSCFRASWRTESAATLVLVRYSFQARRLDLQSRRFRTGFRPAPPSKSLSSVALPSIRPSEVHPIPSHSDTGNTSFRDLRGNSLMEDSVFGLEGHRVD